MDMFSKVVDTKSAFKLFCFFFLCTTNKLAMKEIRKNKHSLQYLRVHLTKEMKVFYSENIKTKKLTLGDGKICS